VKSNSNLDIASSQLNETKHFKINYARQEAILGVTQDKKKNLKEKFYVHSSTAKNLTCEASVLAMTATGLIFKNWLDVFLPEKHSRVEAFNETPKACFQAHFLQQQCKFTKDNKIYCRRRTPTHLSYQLS